MVTLSDREGITRQNLFKIQVLKFNFQRIINTMSRAMIPTQSQLQKLADMLTNYQFLAVGYARTAHARDQMRSACQEIASALNSEGGGCIKTWQQWSKGFVIKVLASAMEKRQFELSQLKSYSESIDNELTMILQSLQWDRKQLLEGPEMVTCTLDHNHCITHNKTQKHEKDCSMRRQGYSTDDQLLPDPLDSNANTLVKFSSHEINNIIENASKADPLFQKGGYRRATPLSLARLQCSYTPDERRAVHDAVVSAVPSCHDLADLALLSTNGKEQEGSRAKSRLEVLAELRDLRRRRAKYRVPAHSRNYSLVLRDVIKTQMEFFTDAETEVKCTAPSGNSQTNVETHNSKYCDNVNNYSNKKPRHYNEADSSHSHDMHRRQITKHEDSKEKVVGRSRSSYREEENKAKERLSRDKERSRDRRYDDYSRRETSKPEVRSSKYKKEDSRHSERQRDSCEGRSDRSYRDKYERYAEEKSTKEEKYKRYYDSHTEDYHHDRKKLKK